MMSINRPIKASGLQPAGAPAPGAGFWTQPVGQLAPGVDVGCTKIAIDLLSLTHDTMRAGLPQALRDLRAAAHVDAAFLVLFDEAGSAFESVRVERAEYSSCRLERLQHLKLADLPHIASRSAHLRITEIADTTHPLREQMADTPRLAAMQVGSLLLVSFHLRGKPGGLLGLAQGLPVAHWDVNLRLLLKLLGSSLSTSLERLEHNRYMQILNEREVLLADVANDAMWDFDVDRDTLLFSDRWKQLLGYSDAQLSGVIDWRDLVHPEDMWDARRMMREYLAGMTDLFESTHRMRHARGHWVWVRSRVRVEKDKYDRVIRVVGVELDITDLHMYEDSLFREKEGAQIILHAIGDGVITTGPQMLIDYINPIAEQLTGWTLDDAIGTRVDEVFRVFHADTCEPLENPMIDAVRRMRAVRSAQPIVLIRGDGQETHVQTSAAPIRDGDGLVMGAVLVFQNVSESHDLSRQLSYQASHDLLTGLVNRNQFEQLVDRALRSARARETSYAICHIDIDQFKVLNDTCGYDLGDQVVAQIGALLKDKIRWRDTLARIGGDEYGVLLEGCTLDEAMRMAEGLRQAVNSHRYFWEDRNLRFSCSIGVVPITAENESVAAIMAAADSACVAAKEQGRNRVHSFAENDIELMRRRREMQWASRIHAALEEGRFELYRMPILALQKPEAGNHFEVLLRLRDEAGRVVSPESFIAAAERYGITPSIDRWVVESTLRWLVSDHDERENLETCAINLSGQSLGDDKFLSFVIEQLEYSGLDPQRICFEITETAAIANLEHANKFIRALREQGCKFSLDDFGSGLSSFGYLKQFPVDYLKIDGSFVRNILHDPIDKAMVRSINEIGQLTGKKTIAEYAENAEIINMLRSMGVDYAQGYGVAQPSRVWRSGL